MNTRLPDQPKHDGVTKTIGVMRTISTGFYDTHQGLRLGQPKLASNRRMWCPRV
jgi:hypothetical protein